MDQTRADNLSFSYCEISKNILIENLTTIKPNKSVLEIDNFNEALNFYDIKSERVDFSVDNVPQLCNKLKMNINLYIKQKNGIVPFFAPLLQQFEKTVNILIDSENIEKISLIANSNFIPKIYNCTVTEQCGFHTTFLTTFKRHISTCAKNSTQVVTAKLLSYGNDITPLTEMIQEGILPPESKFFRKKYFCTWDIETLEQPKEAEPNFDQSFLEHCESGSALNYVAKCRIASIAIGSNLPGIDARTFVRKDSSPQSSVCLVQQFFEMLEYIHGKMKETIPSYIFDAQEHIQSLLEEGRFNKHRTKYLTWRTYLSSFTNMSVFGFNSSKFDLPCIAPLLFSIAKRNGYKISCIKRGTRYLNATVGEFSFRDVLMLSSPCKLSQYLQTWKARGQKSIFPYQKYKNVEELELDTEFPPFDDFYSTLSGEQISHDLYEVEKAKFYKLKSDNKIKNMKCWLVYYNQLDVTPLCKAIENQFEAFDKLFGQDLVTFFSLPSVFQRICFDNFDQRSPLVWSFHLDEYRKDFRSNIVGGLTNVMHRMVNTRDDSGPYSSRHAPDGSRYTHFMFLDFNSLYLWVTSFDVVSR